MNRRGVRAGLVLLFLVGSASAGYAVLRLEQGLSDARAAASTFDLLTRDLVRSILDLRAAQQAYVATGQDRDYWTANTTLLMALASEQVSALESVETDAGGRKALAAIADAMTRFGEMDARVRDHLADDQALMASDLVFTDGLELTASALEQLALAQSLEMAARNGLRQQERVRQGATVGTVVVVGLVVMLFLLPTGQRPVIAPAPEEAAPAVSEGSTLGHLAVDPPPQPADQDDVAGETRIEDAEPTPVEARAPASPDSGLDLHVAALLCTDLGRVTGGEQLPSLLARTAELIDATGIIVWLSDPAGTSLRPALAHGYSPQALAHVGEVACNGDNATAATFRTAEMQIVSSREDSGGAVAVPLLAARGCVGVVAAEVKAGRESSEWTRAIVSIVAAQLVSLVGGSVASTAADPARSETA